MKVSYTGVWYTNVGSVTYFPPPFYLPKFMLGELQIE